MRLNLAKHYFLHVFFLVRFSKHFYLLRFPCFGDALPIIAASRMMIILKYARVFDFSSAVVFFFSSCYLAQERGA